MNVNMRQIENRLADVDWEAAGVDGIDRLTKPMFDGVKAEAEYDARSRVSQAWSVAGFFVCLFLAVSSTNTWGSSAAAYVLITGLVVANYRWWRGRQALQRCHEATYAIADDLACKHPNAARVPDDKV